MCAHERPPPPPSQRLPPKAAAPPSLSLSPPKGPRKPPPKQTSPPIALLRLQTTSFFARPWTLCSLCFLFLHYTTQHNTYTSFFSCSHTSTLPRTVLFAYSSLGFHCGWRYPALFVACCLVFVIHLYRQREAQATATATATATTTSTTHTRAWHSAETAATRIPKTTWRLQRPKVRIGCRGAGQKRGIGNKKRLIHQGSSRQAGPSAFPGRWALFSRARSPSS